MDRKKYVATTVDLERIYNGLMLEEFLKIVSDSELSYFETIISADDIVGVRVNILDQIRNEKVKRLANKYLLFRCADENEFVSKNIIRSIGMNDIEFSDEYFKNLGADFDIDLDSIFKKCPILLSVDKLSRLYGFLIDVGYSEENIITLLTDDKALDFMNCVVKDSELMNQKPMFDKNSFKRFLNTLYQEIKTVEKK